MKISCEFFKAWSKTFNKKEQFYLKKLPPETDLEKEYLLIQEKKCNLSANQRNLVLYFWTKYKNQAGIK